MDRKIEFDFPGCEKAPTINRYVRIDSLNGLIINSNAAISLFKEVFETLKSFKCKLYYGDEHVSLFLEAPRGDIKDFGDYRRGDYESYKEFEETWKFYYPEPSTWYDFTSVKTDFGYLTVFMNNRQSVTFDPRDENNGKTPDDMEEYLHPYIKWLNNALKRAAEMLKEGTYNDYVANNLYYGRKAGTVLRKDFWKAFPKSKEDYLKDISKEDADEFLSLIDQGIGVDKPKERIKEMTLGLFLKACALGYRANYDEDPSLTPRELYDKHADGRDDGLLDIDEDDPKAFEDWENSPDSKIGHPWEVCAGGNSTHIDLYPSKDEAGYFFSVREKSFGRSIEAIKFFLAIHRAGYPVRLYDAIELTERFLGNDKIGIVPHGIIPRYCESWFPGEKIIDFMNVYDDEDKELFPYIKWQEIEKVELAE